MRTASALLCGYAAGMCVATAAETALDFNTAAEMRVAMSAGLYPGLTNLTLSVWVKTATRPASGSFGAIAGRGYLAQTNGFGLFFDGTSGKIVFQARTGGTAVETGAAYPFDGQWHHLAGVREGITNRIYLDGELAGETTGTLPSFDAPGIAFCLGVTHFPTGVPWRFPYKGAMAEVQLWECARSQAQIQGDMFRRLAAAEPGLAGYWPLDEASGATAFDRSGAGNNGAIGGLPIPCRLTEAAGAALLPVSRDPAWQGCWPFALADLETGGTRSTDSNMVAVAGLRIPEGCDVYQISTSPAAPAIVSGGWLPIDTPPAPTAFQAVGEGQPAVLYAWFTNSTASVPLRRSAASILYATVRPGVALDFNNARVAMATALYPTLTDLTLSVWVKTAIRPASGSYGAIAGRGYLDGSVSGFGLYLSHTGELAFQTRDKSTVVNSTTAYPFDGQWHHLAGVREGNVTRLYLDGELMAEKTGAIATLFSSGISFGLGMRGTPSSWGFPFTGAMAEVQLWDHARTLGQIREDMFRCLAGTEAGLAGYWPLNEGTGTAVADWSAAGNHGTRSSSVSPAWTTDLSFGPMLSASEAHLGYWPVTLADLKTGSTRVTGSNVVAVAGVSIPAGYDACQLSASPAVSDIAPDAWGSADMLSGSLTLPTNVGRVCVYAWFTNTAASVPLRRSAAAIVHFPSEAVPDFKESAQSRVEMAKNLYLAVNNLTLSAWVRATSKPVPPEGSSENYGAIAGRGYLNGALNGFGLFLRHTGEVSFQTRAGDVTVQTSVPYPFDGRWHHLAGVRDGNATRLYLDGVLAAEANGTLSTLAMDGIAFGVGARHIGNSWGYFFDGAIAEVQLWDRARTQAQVREDMFRCLEGAETGLIGYWPLSEGAGTVATDRTDAGNDGIVSAPVWLEGAATAAELPASRCPSRQGWWPFALADLGTAGTNATRSNVVSVPGGLAVPAGYDRYQMGASPDGPEPGGAWLSTAEQPSRLTLAAVPEGQPGVQFAWYTNLAASVPLRRSGASIIYAPRGEPALNFSGAERVEMGKGLYPALTNLTLAAWAKTAVRPAPGSYGAIAGRGYLGVMNGFGLFMDGSTGQVTFQTRTGSTRVNASAAYPFDGRWHHLTGVRDGNATRLYLDGALVAEAEGVLPSLDTPGACFGLGARFENGGWHYPLNGALAEVRLYDRALSAKEIRADMTYRLSGDERGLIGYWPLDEAEWRSVQDRSATGADGRVVGAVWDFTADFVRIRPPPGLVITVR
jgi:hypothetical protein